MKTLTNLIIFLIAFHASTAGQSTSRENEIIKNFLRYISNPGWHIDTITNRHVVFYPEESKVASRVKRKFYLSMAVSELEKNLKETNLEELKIIPYNDAGEKLQIMNLGPDYSERSYIVTDPNGKFVRYFLLKDDRIEAFVLFQNKAFLLLN